MAEINPAYQPENLAELEEGKVIRLRGAEIEFVPEEPVKVNEEQLPVLAKKTGEGSSEEASSGEVMQSVEVHLAELAKDARLKIEEIYTQSDQSESDQLPVAA